LDVPAALVAGGTPEQLAEVRALLRDLPEVADLARPRPRHPWRFVDVRPGVPFDVAAVHTAAQRLDAAIGGAQDDGLDLARLGRLRSADDAATWARLADAPRYPLTSIATLLDTTWRPHLQRVRAAADALAAGTGAWRQVVAPGVMQRDVAAVHAAALAADASGFFRRKRRRRAVLAQLSDVLLVPPSDVPLKTLSDLTADLATTYAQVTELRTLVTQTPFPFAADDWNPGDPAGAAWLRDNVDTLTWLGDVLAVDGSALRDDLRAFYAGTPRGASLAALAELAERWAAFDAAVATDRAVLARWVGDDGFLAAWWATRGERRLESTATLARWVDLLAHTEPLRRHGMDAARGEVLDGRVPPDDAVLAFDRGAALTSLTERADATALGDFDVAAHNRTIERFTQATRAVRAELPQAIPDQVLGMRRFDVTSGAGQIGGLVRQLKRERGGMTVRALMEHYGELITEIMPCTLMSPESVARFFPARPGLFDVVVFDEASQIRVADAIGAMGRASSVVVVGDSKQMPPTQVAETSATVEEDEEVTVETVVDEESILSECVQSRVPSKWLSWHYRSQDESLIAFSNRLYYEDRLSSFPAPLPSDTRAHPAGYGISLVRVDGRFERSGRGKALRTNPVEADAIVADVRARFAASPGRAPSLGIITFNAQQRDLVDNLLRDSGDDRVVAALDEPDGLFVKNLENVQGDERDCILFSVAFSANDRGVVP
ncbi:DEAD/DEAH box helicase, partial [Variovorax sp. J22R203]|uniref:DEAD/DEAH box helicase n=1 Tax=Variovorax sp. J22R203 TaxID=3053512 RepID=UPI002575BD3F